MVLRGSGSSPKPLVARRRGDQVRRRVRLPSDRSDQVAQRFAVARSRGIRGRSRTRHRYGARVLPVVSPSTDSDARSARCSSWILEVLRGRPSERVGRVGHFRTVLRWATHPRGSGAVRRAEAIAFVRRRLPRHRRAMRLRRDLHRPQCNGVPWQVPRLNRVVSVGKVSEQGVLGIAVSQFLCRCVRRLRAI